MRLRVRGPKGASTLTLPEEATLADLIENITICTGISNFKVKYGYPPKSLNLNQKDTSQKISELDVKIDGEQLTVCPNSSNASEQADSIPISTQPNNSVREENRTVTSALTEPPISFNSYFNPVSTSRERKDEVPEVSMPHRGATVGK